VPGRGRGRGRGRKRRAVRMLEPALLLLLHQGEAHGYTLLEQLDEFGLSGVNPSVVYRVLRDMEERGWAGSTWDEEDTQGPPRRVYHITAEGDEALRLWAQELGEARARIDHLLSLYDRHMAEGEGAHH
jgi:PadR family transcriptional regulator PadR